LARVTWSPIDYAERLRQVHAENRYTIPDGVLLTVGTVSCDDQVHQAVYLSYTPAGSTTPTMELEILPKRWS